MYGRPQVTDEDREDPWQRALDQLMAGRSKPCRAIGELPANASPTNVSEAMNLQDALNQRLVADGFGRIVGTKIGCTTRVMQEYLGMEHPCSGAIFDSTLFTDTGVYDFSSFLHVGVECEIAVTLGESIPVCSSTYTLETVSCAIASVHAAIEVVDDRYHDFENRIPDCYTWVADDFFGAGAVLGTPVADWKSLDLPSLRGTMFIDGEDVGSGFGRDIINGHPLEALVWLANEQSLRGHEIPAGWVVMLGSVVQTKWISAGQKVEVDIEGLGGAVAQF